MGREGERKDRRRRREGRKGGREGGREIKRMRGGEERREKKVYFIGLSI